MLRSKVLLFALYPRVLQYQKHILIARARTGFLKLGVSVLRTDFISQVSFSLRFLSAPIFFATSARTRKISKKSQKDKKSVSPMKRKAPIGKYVLERKLGRGNYGVVFVCVDSETGERWAMKLIDKEKVVQENLGVQLMREVEIAKRMRHPNVVMIKESLEAKDHYCIVMELMKGGELLGQLTQQGRFTEPVARRYFQQLIVGLNHCHSNGVAHRDLKLDNLLLDENDVVKISDFGLSNFQPNPKTVPAERQIMSRRRYCVKEAMTAKKRIFGLAV